jgi:hypothetical protein
LLEALKLNSTKAKELNVIDEEFHYDELYNETIKFAKKIQIKNNDVFSSLRNNLLNSKL